MYALKEFPFTTPRGKTARMTYRDDSSDWNTVSSIMQPHDEYGLAAFMLTGIAADVGAHIGAATVAMLIDNPGLRVIAIEPVPPNVELLRLNLAANRLTDRCEVIEAAVGKGKTTTIRYGANHDENASHHAFIGNSGIVYKGTPTYPHVASTVDVVTLVSLGPLDFMKIDCEGGEWGFLTGKGLADVRLIVGEAHPVLKHKAPDIIGQLSSTHDVTLNGLNQEVGPCGFVAVRRG